MYYEEKIINGVLMYKNHPDGNWHQYSDTEMSERIVVQRAEIRRLNKILMNIEESL